MLGPPGLNSADKRLDQNLTTTNSRTQRVRTIEYRRCGASLRSPSGSGIGLLEAANRRQPLNEITGVKSPQRSQFRGYSGASAKHPRQPRKTPTSRSVRRDAFFYLSSQIVARSRLADWAPTLRNLWFADSVLEGNGFELVWGFPCQVVFFGLLPVLCSERESRSSSHRLRSGSRSARKGSRDRNARKAWRRAA